MVHLASDLTGMVFAWFSTFASGMDHDCILSRAVRHLFDMVQQLVLADK
jgi:hypothetical protein